MNLQNQLNKLLTVEDIAKLDITPSKRNVRRWIDIGYTVKKGKEPIKLKTIKSRSTVMIDPKDLTEFLNKIGKNILDIPSYMRK